MSFKCLSNNAHKSTKPQKYARAERLRVMSIKFGYAVARTRDLTANKILALHMAGMADTHFRLSFGF